MTTHRDSISRRSVLRGTAALGASTAAVALAGTAAQATPQAAPDPDGAGERSGSSGRVPRDNISIQLYTLRNQLAVDLEGTLAALRAIGYTRVEHAGFVGRTAAQFRAALDGAGLRSTSGHVAIPQPFDAAAWEASLADAAVVGNRYVVHPFFGTNASGPIRDAAIYHAFARDLNRAGAIARRAGFKFGYHNHQNEFLRMSNERRSGFEILTGETDPDLVHLEVDLFWTWRGATDPVDLIHAHRGRVWQVHVKDLDVSGSFTDPGQGLIDFGRIFQHSREAGLIEYIVERDDAGSPPRLPADALTTARVGYDYLAALRF